MININFNYSNVINVSFCSSSDLKSPQWSFVYTFTSHKPIQLMAIVHWASFFIAFWTWAPQIIPIQRALNVVIGLLKLMKWSKSCVMALILNHEKDFVSTISLFSYWNKHSEKKDMFNIHESRSISL